MRQLLGVITVLALAACGGGAGATTSTTPAVVSVPEAILSPDGAMAVTGQILQVPVEDCDPATADCPQYFTLLCVGLTGSIPPQCVGEGLELEGLADDAVPLQSAPDGTRWSEPVVVAGEKIAGLLIVAAAVEDT